MKGLFKSSKARSPAELVSHLRDLLIATDHSTTTTPTRNTKKSIEDGIENSIVFLQDLSGFVIIVFRRLTRSTHPGYVTMSEVKKVILEMRTILYGSDQSEPTTEACAKLTEEFFKGDTMHLLIICLPKLDAGDRQEATYVLANLQRQRVNSRVLASDYLEENLGLVDILVPGYEDDEIALCYGAILRDSTRHQVVARYVLESEHFKKFFGYIQNPNFEIASDAAATFKELLTRHKSTVAEFLSKNYVWFFQDYNSLLESPNYITRRNAIKFLGLMLLDRSNTSVMVQYVSSIDNMRILMNLLRDSNKTIQIEAFHVFKLFAANQNKPPEIVNVLVTNRSKLMRFFGEFRFDKEDEDFKADRAQVVREIETLEPITPSASPRRCEIPC